MLSVDKPSAPTPGLAIDLGMNVKIFLSLGGQKGAQNFDRYTVLLPLSLFIMGVRFFNHEFQPFITVF